MSYWVHTFLKSSFEQDGFLKLNISLQDLIGIRNGLHKGAIQRKVISWSQYPKYVSGRAYYDAAIAVADLAIEYNGYVRPICLPTTPVGNGDVFADDFGILVGKSFNIVQLFCFQLLLCNNYVLFMYDLRKKNIK